ncbi:MAG: radical SAM family heme chaperone HemW [Pseudomonadales bacterium]|jgi:oxygen-independent coproporphyrinogen-3 oxidase|nr:radical SAM family heme chaperone HemW [Pseudomonadales bacterium]
MLPHPAAYIHFPWCVRKCPYCDFNSHPLRDQDDFSAYTHALIDDWQTQQRNFDSEAPFHSVFLGGGTPSLFKPSQMAPILEQLSLTADAEVTMETNPGTTEHHLLGDYLAVGVNRLSIGAQSFDNTQLQKLGRIHNSKETYGAYEQARQAGFANINIDLMWGLPEQTVAAALEDLDAAIALQPEHISWYQLTIEAKTEFAVRTPILPRDNVLADIEASGLKRLQAAGYQRYEVSAFARSGYQCRHNLNYWSFGDYVGIGAGAHGKISHVSKDGLTIERTQKASQPRLYQASPDETRVHPVTLAERPVEFMMNVLRLVDGVETSTFPQRTGLDWTVVEDTWQQLVSQGLVRHDRIATTPAGLRYLDSVLAEFLSPD